MATQLGTRPGLRPREAPAAAPAATPPPPAPAADELLQVELLYAKAEHFVKVLAGVYDKDGQVLLCRLDNKRRLLVKVRLCSGHYCKHGCAVLARLSTN